MQFDPSQLEAMRRITDWFFDPDSNQFKLIGAAGTGKTSLVLPIAEQLELPIHFDRETFGGIRVMAYTNRASRVLNSKGIQARTIHSFAGHPPPELPDDPEVRKEYTRLKQVLIESQGQSVAHQKLAQKTLDQFLLKYRNRDEERDFALDPESILAETDLVIADEMSMIDEETGRIIENQCKKLLILGDPIQLGPPSKFGSYFFPKNGRYDHELTTIHRQGAGHLADFLQGLRDRRHVDFARYAGSRFEPDVYVYRGQQPHVEALRMANVAIARTHDEVFELNHAMRNAKGIGVEGRPQAGEPLIALYQNVQRRLYKNDFVSFQERPEYDDEQKLLRGVVLNDAGKPIGDPALIEAGAIPKMLALPEYFSINPGRKAQIEWKKAEGAAKFEDRWSGVVKLAFGHAITAYQSQGGEWDNVLVKFRSFWRRNASPEEQMEIDESDFRTLYTACSRAKKRLFIYM